MPQSATSGHDLTCSSLFSVEGLVVVVTGGGTGIGLMIAQAFAANGAKVYIIGRREDILEKTAEQYSADRPGNIIPVQGDVTSKSSIEEIVKHIQQAEGYIDVLFNNAGIAGPKSQEPGTTISEKMQNFYDNQDFEDWQKVFNTNVSSAYFVTLAFLKLLEEGTKRTKGRSSCVINISSISGLTKWSQNHMSYNASKAAVIHLTKMMATEFSGLKIRFNSIAPGVFPSEMTTEGSDEKNISSHGKEVDIPAKRAGDVREMAGTAIYLASQAGMYTNGAILPIDGGFLLAGPSAY
ncbi:hypothetical protein DRE_05218 [Drechslerella stenobrocha 248]|uniref:Uncharacterized protein n=1 Tax=Drechslerella stenobrocha 248 TaxID=1043628 RepID=W7HZL6_9PEZI|nr:hypothetical protein DRE_05218 [Drechslerella stenobrocha 248]